ncbi:NlpD protein [Aggregatibacter actinomycetemcomitans serotype e str. SC1083]|uniref:NlpD protein n=1 Tax=Aggregatibacter actinomycetemcomitans serotype e str. SC1083 TaxID=907488 RepID=G4AAY7_AGGAC|nr:murein hydrolase activator EnvC [Aggregatibacter actinomycetemcomitans]EGY32638.1 NlpD protein [Aggregatibacter actinomycetemcomitans serotype e str. SC1083]
MWQLCERKGWGKSLVGRVRIKTLGIFTALLCVSPSLFAAQQDLSKIHQQIKQQEQKIASQKAEQQKLQSTLKTQENQINNVIGQLRQTESDLKAIRKNISDTDKQIKQLQKQEKEQKAKLAKQLDAAYRSGANPSVAERILSDKAQNADRMKAYYAHLNQARMKLIADLQDTQAQLAKQKESIAEQQKTQQLQLADQKKQRQALQKVQQERQSTLNQINRNLSRDESKLEALKANENALRQEIQRAEQAAKQQEQREREALAQKQQAEENKTHKPYKPTEQEKRLLSSTLGLGAPQKQYGFPVAGKVVNSFGSTQMGELRWKGIVIAAGSGTPVKAIADGRVILANWLQGYGLMVIVKHGDSDLSLYGYNQSLAVKEGQLVKAGQKIGEVGSSGGQLKTALYFEIRRKGIAVNPVGWLR